MSSHQLNIHCAFLIAKKVKNLNSGVKRDQVKSEQRQKQRNISVP